MKKFTESSFVGHTLHAVAVAQSARLEVRSDVQQTTLLNRDDDEAGRLV